MISSADLIRVSVRQVIRQRGFGVILSIALGITAFITLAVLGREMRYNIGQDMVLMGGVNIIQLFMDDRSHIGQPQREFYSQTIKALRNIPGVDTVTASAGARTFVFRKGNNNITVPFHAIDEYYWETFEAILISGRFINADDVNGHRRVCVLGKEAAINLFNTPEEALGEILSLENDLFEVVGVISGIMVGSRVRTGFIPNSTMIDRQWDGGKVKRIDVRTIAWEDLKSVVKEIPKIIKNNQKAPNLLIRTRDEQLARIQNTFMFVEVLLWLGIIASLVLGGFGIWYGTFAAVRARTREVGLKKAMGGSDKDILAQFLAEALCKAVAGGFIGIIIGTFCVEIGSYSLGSAVSYPLLLLSSLGSIIFSALIGVGGGLYPALQASRMDVVTALRFE